MSTLLKRRLDDLRRIRELLETVEARFRRAFVEFVREAASDEALRILVEFLEAGRVKQAMDFMEQFTLRFADTVEDAVRTAAISEMATTGGAAVSTALAEKAKPVPVVSVSFDPSNPRVEEVARRQSARMIKGVSQQVREVVQTVIAESFVTGSHPLEIAKKIQESVGLTPHQLRAVENYEKLLRAGSTEAARRDLRDRRSDKKVKNAANKPLSEADITRLVGAYRKNYERYRADMIARTEAQEAINEGRREGMRQTLEQTGLGVDAVEKGWRSARDKHVRGSHSHGTGLDGKTVIGIDTPFPLPNHPGRTIMHPGDPSAPVSERVGCRCSVTYRILSPEERNGNVQRNGGSAFQASAVDAAG